MVEEDREGTKPIIDIQNSFEEELQAITLAFDLAKQYLLHYIIFTSFNRPPHVEIR